MVGRGLQLVVHIFCQVGRPPFLVPGGSCPVLRLPQSPPEVTSPPPSPIGPQAFVSHGCVLQEQTALSELFNSACNTTAPSLLLSTVRLDSCWFSAHVATVGSRFQRGCQCNPGHGIAGLTRRTSKFRNLKFRNLKFRNLKFRKVNSVYTIWGRSQVARFSNSGDFIWAPQQHSTCSHVVRNLMEPFR